MVSLHKRRTSLKIFLIVLGVCIMISATVAMSIASSHNKFAHNSNDVNVMMGDGIYPLNEFALDALGNPANIDCGQNSCLQGITQDGSLKCATTKTRIFGAGNCTEVVKCYPSKKGCPEDYGYYCQGLVPEEQTDCKTEEHYQSDYDDSKRDALNAAILEAQKCCPAGTVVVKYGEDFYCEEGERK